MTDENRRFYFDTAALWKFYRDEEGFIECQATRFISAGSDSGVSSYSFGIYRHSYDPDIITEMIRVHPRSSVS
ncbi:hypothetical protein QUF80_02995 [Desulfococcaceae bacterium HSG8]|nr:hypothetical protein [Desulfococcaceae bacterium HSG8]